MVQCSANYTAIKKKKKKKQYYPNPNNIANTTSNNSENSDHAILMNDDAAATLTVENCQFIGSEVNIFYDSSGNVKLVHNTSALGDVVDTCLAGTKEYGNDTDSCLDSLIDNSCLE